MADRLDSERLRGFCDRRTDRRTDRYTYGQMDICNSRVAFVTENRDYYYSLNPINFIETPVYFVNNLCD